MESSCGITTQSLLLSLALILCSTGVASAESPYRTEVFGSIGAVDYYDPTFFFGSHPSRDGSLNYGAGFGVRPFSVNRARLLRMLGVEFEANGTRHSENGATSTQGFFTANLVLQGSVGRAEPYFVLGGGFSHGGVDTYRAGDIGGGVKVFLTPHLSLRPELRGFVTEYIGNFFRASIGAGYHW